MSRRIVPTAEPIELDPEGTVIAEGVIPGRATPWKAPRTSRHGGIIPTRGYKQYQAYQEHVRLAVATQRPRRKSWPYGGPCELRLAFYLSKRGGRSNPDTSNLVKATEDAMQGVLFENDAQVYRIRAERVFCDRTPERVEYQLIAM